MSAPNVAHLDPQRGGCCTVMPYFIRNIVELPVDLWKTQTEIILQKNGLVSFIVHPDYIVDYEKRLVYEALVQYLSQLRATKELWFALPGEVDTWWRERSRMALVNNGGYWRIVGEGSERAMLAYAKH
jgi:hypothetical protein